MKPSHLPLSSQLPNPAAWPPLHAFLIFFTVWISSQYLAPRSSEDHALIRSGILQLLLVLGLPFTATGIARLRARKVFKLRFTSTRNLLLTLAAAPCLVFLLDEIQFLQSRWMGPESNSVEIFLQAASTGRGVELIFLAAIIPAVCEESLFRGYLLDRLSAQGQTGDRMSSSLLFHRPGLRQPRRSCVRS